jgi:peptide/nickel transport system substrate-binding protein
MSKGVAVFIAALALAGAAEAIGIRVAVSTEPPSLDPTTNAAAVIDLLLHHNLYENLVQLDPQGNLHGQLAASWEVSSDQLTYTFHLREGIRFHDGAPCDAEAVKASFLRLLDPRTAVPHPEYLEDIATIETPDPLTIEFMLRKPSPAFLPTLALGDTVITRVAPDSDLSSHPVGTGPFRFDRWQAGERLVLTRNPHYYLSGVPTLERVEFDFIPDPAAQLAALKAGDVDLVVDLAPEIAASLEDDPRFSIVSGPMNLVQILAINTARPPFTEAGVRRALAYAVDRGAIIDLVDFGFGTPLGSHIPTATPYYADMTWVYPHDPEKARELLTQAGHGNGLEVTITLPGNYPLHVRTGEVIASQLAEVGIRARTEIVDWGTWLDRVYSQADYDLTVIGHPWKLDPALMLAPYGKTRPDYYFRRGWDDPELDELLDRGRAVSDPGRRRAIYTVCQYLIARDAVNVFLQDPHRLIAARRGIGGLSVYPIYVLDLTRVVAAQAP